MQVKRTYGSRSNHSPSLDVSTPAKRKRPLGEVLTASLGNVPTSLKRPRLYDTTKFKSKLSSPTIKKQKRRVLTQLHFAIDQTTLRTCPLCDLSYTKGAPEDESLHRSHCARVQKGMEWRREDEREKLKVGVIEVASQVRVGDDKRGRIISCPAECSGKIGSKIAALLETINLNLSSPPLTQECLRNSKIYMFLLPQKSATTAPNSSSGREKIVGCVVAQRISIAMAIASAEEVAKANNGGDGDNSDGDNKESSEPVRLVAVDSGTSLFCHPKPLPTPMGIPRLFVPSTYRRQGIASALLTAAAATFIHGCPLDPKKGQVAFTQPTGDGKALMAKWGGGGAKIYEE